MDRFPVAPFSKLRLFVAGATPRSLLAIENVRRICSEALGDHADLEIIDVYQQPDLAVEHDIIAVPTLLKLEPAPSKHITGLLADKEHVLRSLGLS